MSIHVLIAKNSLQHPLSKYYMSDIKRLEFTTSEYTLRAVLTYAIEKISTAQRFGSSDCGIKTEPEVPRCINMHCKMIPATKVNKLLYLVDLSGQQDRLNRCSDSELHARSIPGDSHLEAEYAASLCIGASDHIYFAAADTLIKGIGSQADPSAHVEILRTISRVHLHVGHYRTPFVLQGAARGQE